MHGGQHQRQAGPRRRRDIAHRDGGEHEETQIQQREGEQGCQPGMPQPHSRKAYPQADTCA